MPYFHVDDKLHDHRKARAAGLEAMGLWAIAGSWCCDHLTDGFVPEDVAVRWAPRRLRVLASALVTAGLWLRGEKDGEPGWLFHEWDAWGQPTRAGQDAARAAKVEAGRKGGQRSAQTRSTRQARASAGGEAPASAGGAGVVQAESNPQPNPTNTAPNGAAPPTPISVGSRANTLAAGYVEAVPLSNHQAVAGIIRKALNAGYDDHAVALALTRLDHAGRAVTTDALRIELDGPARRSTTDERVRAAYQLADQLDAEAGGAA